MDLGEAMIIAGVGCRRGASAAAIAAAIEAALARAGRTEHEISVIATAAIKSNELGISAAASALGVRLVFIPYADLESASARAPTRSERVAALIGTSSVAEAAALAAGGPSARLLAARVARGGVTWALAETEVAP
jgi:cobalt-precorrin 5A hydrolase